MRLNKLSVFALLALSAAAVPAMADATVKGVVYSETGKPVSDATVRLLHRNKSKDLEIVETAKTNDDGGFRMKKIDDGTYIVVAFKDKLRDRTEITVHDGKDPEMLNFKIRPGKEAAEEAKATPNKEYVNFVGVTDDKNGNPITGATVKLMTEEKGKMVTVDTDESAKKGRFEFYKVRFGHYYVDAVKGKLHERKEVTLDETDGTQSIEMKLK